MLNPGSIYKLLRSVGVNFYTGVPDSLLKHFCACVSESSPKHEHVIAANEGGAVALAAGHYLSTRKCALVYMQNSGLGNAINPLLSLVDKTVFSIPMLVMVGWRGEPEKVDEPQHIKQGEVTLPMLSTMEIRHYILPRSEDQAEAVMRRAHQEAIEKSEPVAVVVGANTFSPHQSEDQQHSIKSTASTLLREEALSHIIHWADDLAVFVATTGKTSRELYELRESEEQGHHKQDFLTVGSMGHCSQVALGISLSRPEQKVICLDGDGAALMHMGAMAMVGQLGSAKFIHVILNNGAHESVGNQPTVGLNIDFLALGKALGYREVLTCGSASDLKNVLQKINHCEGPVLLEIQVKSGSRNDLGRPRNTPLNNKIEFMEQLNT